jgi:uncharacterized protein (TIGR02145 family)
MKTQLILTFAIVVLLSGCKKANIILETACIDNNGNTYKTVTIGNQVWMAENLRTTKYNDGTAIPNVTSAAAWGTLTTGAYCWYNNDAATYQATHGAWYNWYTVLTGKICPTGWHLPSESEWNILTNSLGGESLAGEMLKTSTGWNNRDGKIGNGSNSSGFSGLPSGYRLDNGTFFGMGDGGDWWSTTIDNSNQALFFHLSYWDGQAFKFYYPKSFGFSIRCLAN